MVRGIRAFVLRDLVDEGPAIPQRPWVGQGGASAPGGATHGPVPREAWVRRDWLHVLVREREAVLGSARLSGACSRRARLHNKALKLARSASRVRGHSACTSRPRPGMLLAQLKAKDVRQSHNLPTAMSSEPLMDSVPEPDGDDTKEVYAFFGLAAYSGQVLERGLLNLATIMRLRATGAATVDDYESRVRGPGAALLRPASGH